MSNLLQPSPAEFCYAIKGEVTALIDTCYP